MIELHKKLEFAREQVSFSLQVYQLLSNIFMIVEWIKYLQLGCWLSFCITHLFLLYSGAMGKPGKVREFQLKLDKQNLTEK